MSNSNNKESISLNPQGISRRGEIKDGPSLFCVKRYRDNLFCVNKHRDGKLSESYCFFVNHQNRQLRAEVLNVEDGPGGSAKLTVDFIFTEIDDNTKEVKLRGSIDYHPELLNLARSVGNYEIFPN
jgi:hypothetical protein